MNRKDAKGAKQGQQACSAQVSRPRRLSDWKSPGPGETFGRKGVAVGRPRHSERSFASLTSLLSVLSSMSRSHAATSPPTGLGGRNRQVVRFGIIW